MNRTDILSRVLQESTLSKVSCSLGTTGLAVKTCWAPRWKPAGLGILNRTSFPNLFLFLFFFKKKICQSTYFYWSWLGLYALFWGWSQRGLPSPISSFSFFKKKRKSANQHFFIDHLELYPLFWAWSQRGTIHGSFSKGVCHLTQVSVFQHYSFIWIT